MTNQYDTNDSNYLIRLEHCMLTLFSALCLKASKTWSITLKGTDSKIFSKNWDGTIPSQDYGCWKFNRLSLGSACDMTTI
jgi:hypothetical protein